jgi:murein L,D-transpeptidase YcbB/YkuD
MMKRRKKTRIRNRSMKNDRDSGGVFEPKRRKGAALKILMGAMALFGFLLTFFGALGPPSKGGTPATAATDGSPEKVLSMVREYLRSQGSRLRTGGHTIDLSPEVRTIYLDATFDEPLWVSRDGVTKRARDLVDVVEELEDHALQMSRSRTELLEEALNAAADTTASLVERRNAELLATETFLDAARDLSDGHLEPGLGLEEWGPAVDEEAGEEHAIRVLAGLTPSEILESLTPSLPWYEPTLDALVRYRSLARTGGWPTIDLHPDSVLEAGDSALAVRSLRGRFLSGASEREHRLAERGEGTLFFDERLAEAVRLFQDRHGLDVDGVVGKETLLQLNTPVERRIADLELSLERMRWLPSLGHRAIFVNVAGFELHVLEDSEPVLSMDVVVGRPTWPTAMFTDTMEHVILNPYWHVPESIEKEEILPQVRKDPSYLADNDMVIVPANDNFGEPVPLDEAELGSGEHHDFRQEPGPENDLGRMKFLFPNDHNIYLHDTPADHLFEESRRTFSHGCIRVADPHALARYLFAEAAEAAPSELPGFLTDTERARVDMTERIPVHVYYLTAWATREGTVHFHPDIYGLNEPFESEEGTTTHDIRG